MAYRVGCGCTSGRVSSSSRSCVYLSKRATARGTAASIMGRSCRASSCALECVSPPCSILFRSLRARMKPSGRSSGISLKMRSMPELTFGRAGCSAWHAGHSCKGLPQVLQFGRAWGSHPKRSASSVLRHYSAIHSIENRFAERSCVSARLYHHKARSIAFR